MSRSSSESEESDWWARPAGRAYVKRKSAESRRKGAAAAGSRLVAELNEKRSVQIASACRGPILREPDKSPSARNRLADAVENAGTRPQGLHHQQATNVYAKAASSTNVISIDKLFSGIHIVDKLTPLRLARRGE